MRLEIVVILVALCAAGCGVWGIMLVSTGTKGMLKRISELEAENRVLETENHRLSYENDTMKERLKCHQ